MLWYHIVCKIIVYFAGLVGAFSLNFTYHFFCFQLHKNKFLIVENNLNSIGKSLFPIFEFSFDKKDLRSEERLYSYLIITVPALAMFIRTVYHDFDKASFGAYVFFWQLIFYLSVYLFAKYRYYKFEILWGNIKRESLISRLLIVLEDRELDQDHLNKVMKEIVNICHGDEEMQNRGLIEVLALRFLKQ